MADFDGYGAEGKARIWDVGTKEEIKLEYNKKPAGNLAFSSEKDVFFTARRVKNNQTALVGTFTRPPDGKLMLQHSEHNLGETLVGFAVSPNEQWIACHVGKNTNVNQVIYLFHRDDNFKTVRHVLKPEFDSIQTAQTPGVDPSFKLGPVLDLEFTADSGKLLAGYRSDYTDPRVSRSALYAWNIETGKELFHFHHPSTHFTQWDISPDGRTLLSIGEEPAEDSDSGADGRPVPGQVESKLRLWQLPKSVWPQQPKQVDESNRELPGSN